MNTKKFISAISTFALSATLLNGLPLIALAQENPVPAITSISPSSIPAGSSDTVVTINGSGFVSTSFARLDNTSKATMFVSPTQLTMALPAPDLTGAGTRLVTVVNSVPGGGISNAATLTVTSGTNPVPNITSISPSSATAGSAGFTLTINGANFIPNSVVNVNSLSRPTTFVSSTQLNAALPASDVSTTGTFNVSVANPVPGGGTSGNIVFTVNPVPSINNPVPSISSISPVTRTVGDFAFALTVNGANFVPNSMVNVNGSARTTAFISSTQLTAAVLPSDTATVGNDEVTVTNPVPGGGTSNIAFLTTLAQTPGLPDTGIEPAKEPMNWAMAIAIGIIALLAIASAASAKHLFSAK